MTYTKWRDDWDLDRRRFGWITVSTYSEAFFALDTISNKRVVVKKVKLGNEERDTEKESELLKEYQSNFLVRHCGVLKRGEELWVCCWWIR